MGNYGNYVLAGMGLVVLTYVVVRVGSYAHFRTKLEYFRKIAKEVGGQDGKE